MQTKLFHIVLLPCLFFLASCAGVENHPDAGTYSPPSHSVDAEISKGKTAGVSRAGDLAALCSEKQNFQIPAGFATGALEHCSGRYEEDIENSRCPMRRKVLLVRIAPAQSSANHDNLSCENTSNGCALRNDLGATSRLNTFLSGINRFEIVSPQRTLFNWSDQLQTSRYGNQDDVLVQLKTKGAPRLVDYIVNITPVIRRVGSTPTEAGDYYNTYEAVFITQFLDPKNMTITSDLTVPEIRVIKAITSATGGPVGNSSSALDRASYVELQDSLYDEIYREGLVTIAGHLMQQFPAVARVSALNKDYVALDRGRQEGLSEYGETMLIFQKKRQIAVPIFLASIQPSHSAATGGSQGTIACWGPASAAMDIRAEAEQGEISGLDRKLYAISVSSPRSKEF